MSTKNGVWHDAVTDSWKSEQAVFKAEARIRDQAGRCDVLYFEYDEKQMARQIMATVT